MLAMDLAIILGGVALLAVIGGIVGSKIDRRITTRRAIKKGEMNAELAIQHLHQICVVCEKPINPDVDLFDKEAWWHKECWQQTISNKEE
jgi:hypothetical protein